MAGPQVEESAPATAQPVQKEERIAEDVPAPGKDVDSNTQVATPWWKDAIPEVAKVEREEPATVPKGQPEARVVQENVPQPESKAAELDTQESIPPERPETTATASAHPVEDENELPTAGKKDPPVNNDPILSILETADPPPPTAPMPTQTQPPPQDIPATQQEVEATPQEKTPWWTNALTEPTKNDEKANRVGTD